MRFKDIPYDVPTLKKLLLFFCGMLIACKFTQSAAYVVTLPIALWAISRKNSVWLFAMLLYMSASLCTNTFFIPKTMLMVQLQRGEMIILGAVMLTSIFGQKDALFLSPFCGMFFYIAYMIPVSMNGWAPVVSMMKIALFIPVFFGFYAMAARVYVDERNNINAIRSVVLCFAIYMVVLSVLTWPIPAISQMRAGDLTAAELAASMQNLSLFKGMTQHSQVLGPMSAMVGTVILGDYIFSVRKHSWLYDLILACVLFCIIKSSSRTAMASLLAGCGTIALCLIRAKGLQRKWKQAVMQLGVGALTMMAVAVLLIAPVRQKVLGFVLKYGGSDATAVKQMTKEDILKSRQGKIDECLENWRKNPATGNGFQVIESMKYIKDFKTLLTAPVEKSTWIYAILEEGGVVGEIIFVTWVLTVLILLAKRHAHIGLSCFICMLMLNLGEFVIFSLSYFGAALWALTFAGCVLDSQRYKLSRIIKFNNEQELREAEAKQAFEEFDMWQGR